jgi:hypothetical protein
VQRVTFINARGVSIELYRAPFFLNKIEGLGNVDAETGSQKLLGQDGSIPVNTVLSERSITMEAIILENIQTNRALFAKVFNPKLGQGTLIYENDTFKRVIKAIPEHVPTFYDVRPRKVEYVTIDLICHDPYFTEETDTRTDIALWQSNFEFPLEIPESGMELGYRVPSLIVNVENDGHVDTGMIIKFKAIGGLTNPSLLNVNTTEFIKINRSMLPGEVITINTNIGQKRIDLDSNGVKSNIFNNLVFGSKFLQLEIGSNLFRYQADTNEGSLEVSIHHSPKYVGV